MRLVISDAHAGLVRAIGEVFSGAYSQSCLCHLERCVFDLHRFWDVTKTVYAG